MQPKQWTELQAGIECLTQLLLLIDSMSSVPNSTLSEVAETLQHQLYYNGEVLDLVFEGLQVSVLNVLASALPHATHTLHLRTCRAHRADLGACVIDHYIYH